MPFAGTLTPDADHAAVSEQLRAAASYALELRARPADQRGEGYEADLRSAVDFIHFADPIARALEHAELNQRQADGLAQIRGSRAFAAGDADEIRSMGQQVTLGEDYAAWVAAGGRSRGAYQVEVRNLIGGFTAGAYDSGSDGLLPVGSPVMAAGSMQRRRPFVRNLMSVQSTGLRVVPYVRETNQLTNETGAQMTSEGSAKAEVTMGFENYNAVVEKITAWIPATDEILTDAPTLRGYIDTRLEYMLMIREEQQVLAGTGSTPQIQGLSTLSGTQSQVMITGGGETTGDWSATIGASIGLIENVDGDADGVVSNPIDYWTATIKRHANQFDNGFGSGAPGAPGNISWGLPVVRTRAQATGTAWVGAWALGSTLFDRQQTTIKVGDQHSDYLIRNLLVILAEKRIAVAWHRPNLFVKATVPTS